MIILRVSDARFNARMRGLITGALTFVHSQPPLLAREIKTIIVPLVKEEAPQGATGELFAGIEGSSVVVRARAPYVQYVIRGTGQYAGHSTWDVTGKLQVFEWHGELIFTMATHHFGQKPNPFPRRALRRARPEIAVLMRATMRLLLRTRGL